ncbi:conserved hypothetical protein [Paraburkholderia ribeironis]|uniref:Cryptic plasmid protein A n=1 Tax=Paraburkholderia ribeironis TaxID=1247936 RepID=A0A1N7SQH0_9BURK|nr:hypothetical protein [Paraburkholderia ribeironis]SIT49644.1 conserved hypothetical protein [Paraburkholderia ribeironis]
MEHLVCAQNEWDRRTLAWLREHVGDAAIEAAVLRHVGPAKSYLSAICRKLGVTAPEFAVPRRRVANATAEQSLATIRQIQALRGGQRPPKREAVQRP